MISATLDDEDNNSIPSDEGNRAILRKVAMQSVSQIFKKCHWQYVLGGQICNLVSWEKYNPLLDFHIPASYLESSPPDGHYWKVMDMVEVVQLHGCEAVP